MEPENDGFGSDNCPFLIGAQTLRFSRFVRFQNVGLGVVIPTLPCARHPHHRRELGVRPVDRAFLKKEEMVGSRNLKVPILFPPSHVVFLNSYNNWSNLQSSGQLERWHHHRVLWNSYKQVFFFRSQIFFGGGGASIFSWAI